MSRRWVITHWTGSLRVSTLAAQARNTFATQEECQKYIEIATPGLTRVIGDRVRTLRATEVECYESGDPVRAVFEDES